MLGYRAGVRRFRTSCKLLRMNDSQEFPLDVDGPRFPRSLSLDVYLLGIVDFDSFLVLQDRLADDIATSTLGRERGVLLVCEHPPVLTFGRDASVADLAVPESEFVARGIETRWLARGGGAILQSPGQLSVSVLVGVGEDARLAVTVRSILTASLGEAAGEFEVRAPHRSPRPVAVGGARWLGGPTTLLCATASPGTERC